MASTIFRLVPTSTIESSQALLCFHQLSKFCRVDNSVKPLLGFGYVFCSLFFNKTSSSPGYITKTFSHKCCLSAHSCFFFLPDFFESSLPRPDCRVPANSISHFVSPPLSYINYTRSGKTAGAHRRFGSAYHKDSNHNIVEKKPECEN